MDFNSIECDSFDSRGGMNLVNQELEVSGMSSEAVDVGTCYRIWSSMEFLYNVGIVTSVRYIVSVISLPFRCLRW
jgi:hypothetical protein